MWPFSHWHKQIKDAEEHEARARHAYAETVSDDAKINALTSEAQRTHARLREQDERNHFTDTLFGLMGRQL